MSHPITRLFLVILDSMHVIKIQANCPEWLLETITFYDCSTLSIHGVHLFSLSSRRTNTRVLKNGEHVRKVCRLANFTYVVASATPHPSRPSAEKMWKSLSVSILARLRIVRCVSRQFTDHVTNCSTKTIYMCVMPKGRDLVRSRVKSSGRLRWAYCRH